MRCAGREKVSKSVPLKLSPSQRGRDFQAAAQRFRDNMKGNFSICLSRERLASRSFRNVANLTKCPVEGCEPLSSVGRGYFHIGANALPGDSIGGYSVEL
jgi:hypothetical protein